MKWKAAGPGVLAAAGRVASAGSRDIARLKRLASRSPRRRARLCAHLSPKEGLHDMIIVLARGCYIRPHRHRRKVESYHVIEGSADAVRFDGQGRIAGVLRLGPRGSGQPFFLRDGRPGYHTFVVRSAFFVFHETTQGPFRKSETAYPAWAPAEGGTGIREYQRRLERALAGRGRTR